MIKKHLVGIRYDLSTGQAQELNELEIVIDTSSKIVSLFFTSPRAFKFRNDWFIDERRACLLLWKSAEDKTPVYLTSLGIIHNYYKVGSVYYHHVDFLKGKFKKNSFRRLLKSSSTRGKIHFHKLINELRQEVREYIEEGKQRPIKYGSRKGS